jgi:hypothetical protein
MGHWVTILEILEELNSGLYQSVMTITFREMKFNIFEIPEGAFYSYLYGNKSPI